MSKIRATRKNLEKLQRILIGRNTSDYDYSSDNSTQDEHKADDYNLANETDRIVFKARFWFYVYHNDIMKEMEE